AITAKPLDGRDHVALGAEGGDQARVHGLAVEQHRAGAAVAGVAALLDAEMSELAQKCAQALASARLLRKCLAVDLESHDRSAAKSSERISSPSRKVIYLRHRGLPWTSS